jgi:K319-like protein/uncharacterized protein DUF922
MLLAGSSALINSNRLVLAQQRINSGSYPMSSPYPTIPTSSYPRTSSYPTSSYSTTNLYPRTSSYPTSNSYPTTTPTSDIVPPDTQITSAVDSIGKPIQNGGTTTANSIVFTFRGIDNIASGVSNFQCSYDNRPYSACGSQINLPGLTVGGHSFAVVAIDLASNMDRSPAFFTWTVTKAQESSSTSSSSQLSTSKQSDNTNPSAGEQKSAQSQITKRSTQSPTLAAAAATCSVDLCVNPGETATFQVACTNPDSRVLVTCIMTSGPPGATFSSTTGNPAVGTMTWTNVGPPGTYQASFQAITVSCPSDIICIDSPVVTFTILVNHPPVANAGSDQTDVKPGDTVTLNGAGSSDADNEPLTYSWTQTAGPSVTLSDASSSNPTFTAPQVDTETTLTFELTVSDGKVDSEPATVNIIISVNHPPVANAGSDQTVTSGDTVTLNGAGSSDPDGDPLTYTWSQSAGPSVALSDAHSVNPTFTASDIETETTLTFQLTVNDGKVDSQPSSVSITVRPNSDKCDSQANAFDKSSSDSCCTTPTTLVLRNDRPYSFQASTLVGASKNFIKPNLGIAGLTTWTEPVDSGTVTDPKTGRIVCMASLTEQVTVQLPIWTNVGALCPAIQTEWSKFLPIVSGYEQQHVDLVKKTLDDFAKKVIGKTPAQANALELKLYTKLQQDSDKIDKSGKHTYDSSKWPAIDSSCRSTKP